MDDLPQALTEAGGPHAGREHSARLGALLERELSLGQTELGQARSGRDRPVHVAFAGASDPPLLLAATPVAAALRVDPDAAPERAWLLAAAAVGALVDAGGLRPPADGGDLLVRAGDLAGHLVLAVSVPAHAGPDDAELAVLAFDEHVAGVDRLRSRGLAVPADLLDGTVRDLREPIGAAHPLRVAELVARLGGRPADPASGDEHEDAVLAMLAAGAGQVTRPHDDPDPARRVARRVLQRLDGMGKWGGYHTEFAHLARGFKGNDRALAERVGEALLAGGLLAEKPSVGQRHVFLNPRRARDIRRLIDEGATPPDLRLP
jgi:hypothetical protein